MIGFQRSSELLGVVLPGYLAVWNKVTHGKKRTANCGCENYNSGKSFYVIKYSSCIFQYCVIRVFRRNKLSEEISQVITLQMAFMGKILFGVFEDRPLAAHNCKCVTESIYCSTLMM